MSTFNPHHKVERLYEAANTWAKQSLLGGSSLFNPPEAIWTSEFLDELDQKFNQNPDEGGDNFLAKLERQLATASPAAVKLMAELLWVHSLFPSKVGPAKKRQTVIEAWSWSGNGLALPQPLLSDEVLGGIGSAGTAYNTHKWRELAWLITCLRALRLLDQDSQRAILTNGQRFIEWLNEQPGANNRQLLNILPHILFPDEFERISSRADKESILASFTSEGKSLWRRRAVPELDRALLTLRHELEVEKGTPIDFYLDDLKPKWKSSVLVDSAASTYRRIVEVSTSSEMDIEDRRDDGLETFTVDNALEELFLEREEVKSLLFLWRAKKNLVLQGPPGVGKSFAAQRLAYALIGAVDPERVGFVQFHQSYSYEDFIQGYRPSEEGFSLRDGKFVAFCHQALAEPEKQFVFIIDEINRGNLSRILGELMLLIESDKREAKWAMPLAYSDPKSDSDTKFYVPANVHLLGLMNTADRSLAVVDYALRRRFAFLDLPPRIHTQKFADELANRRVPAPLVQLIRERVGALNAAITEDVANLGPGFAIGHSFFCAGPVADEDGEAWYRRVIQTEILPLLREYWFDAPGNVEAWAQRLLG